MEYPIAVGLPTMRSIQATAIKAAAERKGSAMSRDVASELCQRAVGARYHLKQ